MRAGAGSVRLVVMDTTVASSQRQESVASQVLHWRTDQLRKLGFEPEDAALLAAQPDVDIHRARHLIRRGCPPKTALRILL